MSIALLWDKSYIWGLLAVHALQQFGVAFQPLKSSTINQKNLSDKFSLLLVPGGTARSKLLALKSQGCDAVRHFVAEGGHYLGFCGGAGLALNEELTGGLGLCPWTRIRVENRRQHLLSGPMELTFPDHTTSPLLPQDCSNAAMPVWWPGRFEIPKHPDEVTVLARYVKPAQGAYAADLALDQLSEHVLQDWLYAYNITLTPDLHNTPCVISGNYGHGTYLLSYTHLETPHSPRANQWFAQLLQHLANVTPTQTTVPEWHMNLPVQWANKALEQCRNDLETLLQTALAHGLLFERSCWLIGWRAGVPGGALNNLRLALNMLLACTPPRHVEEHWKTQQNHFCKRFGAFLRNAEACLLAQRLAITVPGAVPSEQLNARQNDLFGTAMYGGGLYQELLDELDALLFESIKNGSKQ